MASQIDPTKPADAVPAVKADLRANLQAAKDEIEALQSGKAALGHTHTLSEVTDAGDAAGRNVGSAAGDVAAGDRGLPAGGSPGQVLAKQGAADYDAAWQPDPGLTAVAQDPNPQLGGTLDGDRHPIRQYRQRKYNDLVGDQTLSAAGFEAGSTLVHAGPAATYTLASRLSANDTEVTEALVVHNRGSGPVSLAAAAGLTLLGDAAIGQNASATLEWEHDGTTERVWARSTG